MTDTAQRQKPITLTKTVNAMILPYFDLDATERMLLCLAAKAREHAQAPYSHYHVGAAILPDDKRHGIFTGCNVERVSYTQTTHAEQNALDSYIATRGGKGSKTKIRAVAIVAGPGDEIARIANDGIHMANQRFPTSVHQVGAPCGHCLQILWENCHGDRSVRLLTLAANGHVVVTTIGDALPMAFGPEALGISP
jgi:cytidine deaminase